MVYLLFALSGASALVYQVIWARWLSLVFGNTTVSISIVLGAFMTGLALGSWLASRLLHRINHPMQWYAFMELAIGAFALCFPLLTRLADGLFTHLVSGASLTASSLLLRAILAVVVLVLPTTCMGTTLPLLTDFFHRSKKHSQVWRVGLLYSANTLGAAAGVVVASFVLIELIGVLATTLTAAALNFVVALIGYRLSANAELRSRDVAPAGPQRLHPEGRFAVAMLTISGALALASEVLWTRTLETVIGNSTYAFGTILLLYLVGIAGGSWVMALLVKHLPREAMTTFLPHLFLAMGAQTMLSIFLFDRLVDSVSALLGSMVPLTTVVALYCKAASLLLPLSLLSGACFPLAIRILDPSSEDATGELAATAYSWNTLGAIAGSFVGGFVIAPHWDYFTALYMVAAAYCLTAVAAYGVAGVYWSPVGTRAWLLGTGVLATVGCGVALPRAIDENYYARRFEARHPDQQVIFHQPGLQGVTTVIKHRQSPWGEYLLVNGIGMTIKATDTKLMAHLPMLLHPHPQNTLVICLGMGTTYRSAISHGMKVTVVELVGEVVDALNYFYEDAARLRQYPGGRIVVNDGRNFLKLTRQKFDVITLDPPPPIDAAGVTNLYSKEFIELARDHLEPGGIMAHWMPYPGRRSGVDDLPTQLMLINTFAKVFPYTYAHNSYNKIGAHLVGSMQPIDLSADHIRHGLLEAAVSQDINEWDQVPPDFFVTGWIPVQAESNGTDDTDNRPRLEFYFVNTLMSGQKKMFPVGLW